MKRRRSFLGWNPVQIFSVNRPDVRVRHFFLNKEKEAKHLLDQERNQAEHYPQKRLRRLFLCEADISELFKTSPRHLDSIKDFFFSESE